MMTYGDGLANVNLAKLYKFHKKNKKLVTVTTVRPPARFGYVNLDGNKVSILKKIIYTGGLVNELFVLRQNFQNILKMIKLT